MRAGSAAVRAVQSGFLRAYAALLLLGLAGLGLYFLIAATDVTIHLSIVLFAPLVFAPRRRAAARDAAAAALASPARWSRSSYAVVLLFDFDAGQAGLQYVTDAEWITTLGIRYTLGVDGLNLWLIALTALLFAGDRACGRSCGRSSGRGSGRSTSAWPRRPCSARSWPRTWSCSSRSST